MSFEARDSGVWGVESSRALGPYLVGRELGRGGMARVYEGRHVHLGHRVALKMMHPGMAFSELATTRFMREASLSLKVRHQHVIQIFDAGMADDLPFLVMELLEGPNLASYLAERGPLDVRSIVEIFLPVISAITAAHHNQIIHRDLKPSNVILTKRAPAGMHPVVLDFGISKLLDQQAENALTRTDALIGTVHYMAPEVTEGAEFAGPLSDQYAIGVMLYECATGVRPFSGDSQYQLMRAILSTPVTPPSRLAPALPAAFDAIVARAMHRDPAKRFPSVNTLGAELMSLASKRVWYLWRDEFFVGGHDHEPALGTSTLADEPGEDESFHGSTKATPPIRWKTRGLTWLAVGALVAAACLWTVRHYEQTARSTPLASVQAPVAGDAAAIPKREEIEPVIVSAPIALPSASGREPDSKPTPAKPGPFRASSARKDSAAAGGQKLPQAERNVSSEVGANGAFILE